MYTSDYRTGDEYDTPCEEWNCGMASHDHRCPFYTPPEPPKSKAQIEQELDTLVSCIQCGKQVRFREVQQTAACDDCNANDDFEIIWL